MPPGLLSVCGGGSVKYICSPVTGGCLREFASTEAFDAHLDVRVFPARCRSDEELAEMGFAYNIGGEWDKTYSEGLPPPPRSPVSDFEPGSAP